MNNTDFRESRTSSHAVIENWCYFLTSKWDPKWENFVFSLSVVPGKLTAAAGWCRFHLTFIQLWICEKQRTTIMCEKANQNTSWSKARNHYLWNSLCFKKSWKVFLSFWRYNKYRPRSVRWSGNEMRIWHTAARILEQQRKIQCMITFFVIQQILQPPHFSSHWFLHLFREAQISLINHRHHFLHTPSCHARWKTIPMRCFWHESGAWLKFPAETFLFLPVTITLRRRVTRFCYFLVRDSSQQQQREWKGGRAADGEDESHVMRMFDQFFFLTFFSLMHTHASSLHTMKHQQCSLIDVCADLF